MKLTLALTTNKKWKVGELSEFISTTSKTSNTVLDFSRKWLFGLEVLVNKTKNEDSEKFQFIATHANSASKFNNNESLKKWDNSYLVVDYVPVESASKTWNIVDEFWLTNSQVFNSNSYLINKYSWVMSPSLPLLIHLCNYHLQAEPTR